MKTGNGENPVGVGEAGKIGPDATCPGIEDKEPVGSQTGDVEEAGLVVQTLVIEAGGFSGERDGRDSLPFSPVRGQGEGRARGKDSQRSRKENKENPGYSGTGHAGSSSGYYASCQCFRKRYPKPRTVSMNREAFAGSLSFFRMEQICTFRLSSSTMESGLHRVADRSSLRIRNPW